MRIDFSRTELMNRAFSDKPMTFCDPAPKNFLLAIIDLLAIETGNRKARENWQNAQLHNLLVHASQRSAFWRQRIGTKRRKDKALSSLPILSRREVIEQVENEGSLLSPSDQISVKKHSTSGSSGMPIFFFVSAMNAEFNHVRSSAQYFLEGRDLAKNKTVLQHWPHSSEYGLIVERKGSWLAPLSSFFKTGQTKLIQYFHPDYESLLKELARDQIGYLVSSPRIIEALLEHVDAEFFKNSGMAIWLPIGEGVDTKLNERFYSIGMPVLSTYSTEEVGLIASECEKVPGNYHVATSNVIIEVCADEGINVGDANLGRVLVTHLHSYATPFIRYDVGDLASLSDRCSCGHDGPVVSNIHGRSRSLLKHHDGRISPFNVRNGELLRIAKFTEYRIRQTGLKTIIVELGGIDDLTQHQTESFTNLIRMHSGAEFNIIIKAVGSIDWENNRKRLGFHSDML
jgi:phenylacetate-CoA ligase